MDQRAGEREPLLPAPGQLAGELPEPLSQVEKRRDRLDAERELSDGRQGAEPASEVAGLDRSLRHGKRGSSRVTVSPALRRPPASPLSGSTLIPNTRSARSRSVSAARGVNSAWGAISATRPANRRSG